MTHPAHYMLRGNTHANPCLSSTVLNQVRKLLKTRGGTSTETLARIDVVTHQKLTRGSLRANDLHLF